MDNCKVMVSVPRHEAAWQAGWAQINKLVQAEGRASRLWLVQQVTPAGHTATIQTSVHTIVLVIACRPDCRLTGKGRAQQD